MASKAKVSEGESFELKAATGRPLKVLIVEDESQIARLIELELSYEGYQVDIAKTGKEALDKIENFKPDLIVMDWLLPEIDGLELIRRIRSDGSDIPIIVLTGKDSLSDKVIAISEFAQSSR